MSALPFPSWDEIVEHMQDKQLSGFAHKIVKVIYSKDRLRRIILLQSENGFFTPQFERLYVWDEDEWFYFGKDNIYPAFWQLEESFFQKSIYASEEIALNEIKQTPEYKTYFE